MSVHFDKVVIIGVGLIGASLGLAAREKGIFGETVGVGRGKANLDTALGMGAVDRTLHDAGTACRDADLVVLATPVERIFSIGRKIAPLLPKGACLTDVGSVKQELVEGLQGAVPEGVEFVGGHPIAGSEDSGAAAARADLFEGSLTILTPTRSQGSESLSKIRSMWEKVGSRVLEMDAAEHDIILAAVSHLPHMAAYALANVLAEREEDRPDLGRFAAGGFRDITRIASSPPEVWREICKLNKKNIVDALGHYESVLQRIRQEIEGDRFEELGRIFERARAYRDEL